MSLVEQLWKAARDGDLDGVNQALAAGAEVNARGEYGDTALNLAAGEGHVPVAERLLELGADIENLGGADLTPLMNATFAGHTRMVQFLLDRGARVTRDLLMSLNTKVGILEENAEEGYVNPEAAAAWRQFLDYMAERWREQNPDPPEAGHENRVD